MIEKIKEKIETLQKELGKGTKITNDMIGKRNELDVQIDNAKIQLIGIKARLAALKELIAEDGKPEVPCKKIGDPKPETPDESK